MGMVGKDLRLRYIMRRFGLVGWCWDWVSAWGFEKLVVCF